MVPRIGNPGSSFKGAGLYYLHDKDALTTERVAFTHTENLETDDAGMGMRLMASTANDAGFLKRQAGVKGTSAPGKKPVWTMSLAWHPEQEPTPEHMVHAAKSALAKLGLHEHQVVMVAHRDEAHPHIHTIVNLIHPETGRTATLPYSKSRLSKWAEAYEKEHGKIYCAQRVENNAQREQGKTVFYQEPELDLRAHVTKLYHASDSGKAFQAALRDAGYSLAKGKKIVLIDREGCQHSLARQIEGVKEKDIRAKLASMKLPNIEAVRGELEDQQIAEAKEKEQERSAKAETPARQSSPIIVDRDRQNEDWQEAVIDAGIAHRPAAPPDPRPRPADINALQGRHLAELGNLYAENQKARDKVETMIEETYGAYVRTLRGDIDTLAAKLKGVGPLRQWWLKKTNRLPADAAQVLSDMRESLANVEWRKSEARQAVEARITLAKEQIHARQDEERRLLENKPPAAGGPQADRDKYLQSIIERNKRILQTKPAPRSKDRGREGPDFEP